jgi:hypothetical protein
MVSIVPSDAINPPDRINNVTFNPISTTGPNEYWDGRASYIEQRMDHTKSIYRYPKNSAGPMGASPLFGLVFVLMFRVRVTPSLIVIDATMTWLTTIPLDKVTNHFSDRIIINYDF